MKNIEAVQNPKYDLSKAKDSLDISMEIVNEVFKFHESIGNQKTPLIKLSGLADDLEVQSIFVKSMACSLSCQEETHLLQIKKVETLGALQLFEKLSQLDNNSCQSGSIL